MVLTLKDILGVLNSVELIYLDDMHSICVEETVEMGRRVSVNVAASAARGFNGLGFH